MSGSSTVSVSTSHEADDYASSDTSSFYGSAATKAKYEKLSRKQVDLDYNKLWKWNIQVIAARGIKAQKKAQVAKKRKFEDEDSAGDSATKKPKIESFNPCENAAAALKLGQPIEEFLNEFVPSSGRIDSPWIWCANFHAGKQEQDVASFTQLGSRLLESFKENLSKLGRNNAKIAAARRKLQEDIFGTARKCNVKAGKWMLFPTPGIVDKSWAAIVRAVVDGRLGIAAKVATRPDNPKHPTRVICVYTRDFEDERDIKRVLIELVRLKLCAAVFDTVGENARKQIWYKPDCYTYLDLKSGNEFKIKPSLYGTASLLTETDI